MYKRNLYIERVKPYMDKPIIKVITGMRRIGKSCFLKLIIEELSQKKITPKQLLYIDKESLKFDFIQDYKALYNYVNKFFSGTDSKRYLFIDEIQEISGWEKAIASYLGEGNFDIYITGSNARLLSSDIATVIAGRYIEIPVYSLGFDEFLMFTGFDGGMLEDAFSIYLWAGGLPGIHHFDLNQQVVYEYINAIYNTILLKDVIKKNNIRNISLLENITRYLFDNIGNIFTAKKISDYLKSQKIRVSVDTVQNYISYLASAFAIYKVPRYDIKGKRLLELHEKYFLSDIALRHALLGYREGDISGILENLVFLELKRRGYKVFIGKLDKREIDFIAEKENKKIYVQVAYILESKKIIEREFSPLKAIRDNYPKYVITMDKIFGKDVEGIQRLNLIDFLLDKNI